MRHDWIFNVLADLQTYAEKNDLPAIAAAAKQNLIIARSEIATKYAAEEGKDPGPKRPN
jgi:hypothetical protein